MRRSLNWTTFLIGIALICLAAWTTIRIKDECNASHLVTELHVAMDEAAQEMHKASEFLTLEARQFALTHNESHLQKYLYEMFHTRTRENSLSVLYGNGSKKLPGSEALSAALERSDILAKKELYAMRLVAEASNINLNEYPELAKTVRLTSADAALDNAAKLERARELLFNDAYTLDQYQIMEAIHHFMTTCGDESRLSLALHIEQMDSLIMQLMLLLAAMLVCVIVRMAMLFGVRITIRSKGTGTHGSKQEKPC